MLCPQTNTTVVGRLRIRSKSSDPQAEQQRIERMLRSATLHPSGLPESRRRLHRLTSTRLPGNQPDAISTSYASFDNPWPAS